MIGVEVLAAAAYLLPVALWTFLWVTRAGTPGDGPREARDEGRFAVMLAVVVAVDLLSVLLLARFFRLETATLVSRATWAVGAAMAVGRWWRAGGRPRWPSPQQARRLGELALVVAGAALLSLQLSRACQIWDRDWHIPLVSALRGQRLPFMNVYDPAGGLFYHFAGDVQAAMLQTLSGGRLHSSLALSLLHDIMFALIALNVVCFLRATGLRRTLLAALVFVAVVMIGPVTLLRNDVQKLDSGFGLVNFLTLSFRPHVALAYLLELAFLEIVLTALLADVPSVQWRGPIGALALLAAALAITDESSLGMLGLGVGALWLVNPAVLAPTRRSGALALGALLAAIVVSLVIFGGSIGPSAPHYQLSFVVPRAPGYASPPVPLTLPIGRSLLFQDLVPVLGVLAALVAIALRTRERVTFGLAVLYTALAAASLVTFTSLDFEGKSSESHRFVTALFIAAPLLAAVALGRRARAAPLGVALGGVAALAIYATIGLGVASTIEWLGSGVANRQCATPGFAGWSTERFYDLSCRDEADSALGETTTQTYVDQLGFYLWAGCHPVFAPAPPLAPGEHKVKVGGPWYGASALAQLRQRLPSPVDRLEVVCLMSAGPTRDAVCARSLAIGPCRPRGSDFMSCTFDGSGRATLAGRL